MNSFDTIDINKNKRSFQYYIEKGDELLNSDHITFKVYSIPENELRWFSYRLKIIDDDSAKSELMDINGNIEFSKKGIPERIIEIASSHLKRNIISSPIDFSSGDYLVPSAKKAWERLIKQNSLAKLNEGNNCYILKWK